MFTQLIASTQDTEVYADPSGYEGKKCDSGHNIYREILKIPCRFYMSHREFFAHRGYSDHRK